MTYGPDGTFCKVNHTIYLGGYVAAGIKVNQVAEPVDGVGLKMSCRVVVGNPLLLDALEIHVVVDRQGIGP